MKKILIILFCVAVTLHLGGVAFGQAFNTSGNPGDTPAGGIVTCEGSSNGNGIQYRDTAGNSKATVEGNAVRHTVSPEAGFSSSNIPSTLYFYSVPGSTVSWTLAITSEGNDDETLTATGESGGYSGGASNWTALFNYNAQDTTEVVTTLTEDGDEFITINITPSSDENESPDASTGSLEVWAYIVGAGGADTGSDTGGKYTGANLLDYGGNTLTYDYYTVEIMAPSMTLTKTATIDAPTSSEAYQTGDIHAPIPGAVWIFTITYNNTGSGTAENVVIYDKVPANTQIYALNLENPEDNLIVTAASETASGWTRYYSTSASPTWGYLGAATGGWSAAGTTGTELKAGDESGVIWVKWEKASVPASDTATMQWAVDIY